MTPYVWRLCCLSLAALIVVQLGVGLVLRLFVPRIVRFAERFDPARAALLMLLLRWMPGILGVFAASCLCVPSYLRLEPASKEEEIGIVCLALAGLAILSYLVPMARAASGVFRSEQRLRALVSDADVEAAAGVCVIRETSPAMALVGLFHSRVLVSREVMRMLPADQMDVALRHERAHLESGDNYKRLLLEAAPLDLCGWALRTAWSRFAEWAADDQAADGDSARSVALASALVSVARLGAPELLPQASLLVSDGRELRVRVERLLDPSVQAPRRFPSSTIFAALFVSLALLVALAQQPAVGAVVHQLLEALVD